MKIPSFLKSKTANNCFAFFNSGKPGRTTHFFDEKSFFVKKWNPDLFVVICRIL
jgi:hypothetical protein